METQDKHSPSLVSFVGEMSRQDIEDELLRVRRNRARLEAAEQLLLLARRLVAPELDISVEAPDGDVVIDVDEPYRPATGTKTAHVLGVLESEPDESWTPEEIVTALATVGESSPRESVRVMLQRLVKGKAIRRTAPGRYQALEQTPADEVLFPPTGNSKSEAREAAVDGSSAS